MAASHLAAVHLRPCVSRLRGCASLSKAGAETESEGGAAAVGTETLLLEAASLPKVIGKAGARINLIRQASGCKVWFQEVAACGVTFSTQDVRFFRGAHLTAADVYLLVLLRRANRACR